MGNVIERLRELTALTAISSREDEAVRYMVDAFRRCTPHVEADMLGNVTAAFPCGRENAQRVMVFAHMDEVGLIVRSVEPDGFLRMERLTAVNGHVVPGTVLRVRTHGGEYISGVVGAKSHHVMSAEEKNRVPELGALALDIGCKSRAEACGMGVTEGCVIAFAHNFIEMPNRIVASKSLDDRVGLAALLELAEHLSGKTLDYDMFIVASVQEEFSIRGIMPASRKIDPDIAIGIDITPAADSPDMRGVPGVRLGDGPAFTYYNYHGRGTLNGIVPNEALVHFLEDVCRKQSIPFQREVCRGVLTETAYISISGAKGVATANISIPTRYTHTPVETACLDDIECAARLLCAFADCWNPDHSLKKINL